MFRSFAAASLRTRSIVLLAVSGLLALMAWLVGINDNPLGILLLLLASVAFVVAFVRITELSRHGRSGMKPGVKYCCSREDG